MYSYFLSCYLIHYIGSRYLTEDSRYLTEDSRYLTEDSAFPAGRSLSHEPSQ
jgi:hypothetical protein